MRIRPVGAHALLLDCAEPDPDLDPDAGAEPEPGTHAGSEPEPEPGTGAGAEPEPGTCAGSGAGTDPAGQVEAWRAELWRRREAGELTAVEIVPAATTVLLDGVPDPAATAARIAGWTPRPTATTGSIRTVEVPVTYDGADLPRVADHWGVDVPEVVRRLTGTLFRVAFCGFAPGFAYLTGLPTAWAVPRLPTPRPRVPAGSVALAGPYAGIYPTASPGGWLLVGRTDLPLFDVRADPPATLTPGSRVRLVAA
ncbi:sensor histidine kinase inhibitor, KipI family [Micromonospora pallida]|uniref:Sensor histidine kinase inhibitor, KipI family n=1 Tax=Micromonospora pallida TaxID=145854 RepID=A0A1C6TAB3_9ACTN|nr:allophanate hydrolase subunit 1 [Micromonospora pallida]SCL38453.1 sensor histidine kinase inhibitor, KipI family [Micromonospora pallida]